MLRINHFKVETLLNKYRQTVSSQDSLEAEINMYFRNQMLITVVKYFAD